MAKADGLCCKLQVFILESETKKYARALQREVGDEIPLNKVLEEGSHWKGRREQVIALKEQIKQLKEAQVGSGPLPLLIPLILQSGSLLNTLPSCHPCVIFMPLITDTYMW